ncbi:MAG: PAS domain-containing protein, partial [Gaiellaceae bacterium]
AAELESLGIASWMCVPVSARGRTLGAISLLTAESGRRYSEHDLSLAEELARRAGLAVDNARLFDEAERSLALLDTLLASAPIGMAFFDTDLRYVRVNAALAEINGRPPAEHVGRTLAEVIPDLAPTLEPIYRRVLETGEPFAHHEITGMTPASPGAARHWLSSYYPVKTEQGETLGVGAVITEITERKRAEDERARLLEAEQGARAVAEAAQGRLHLLAEASRVLASSLDFETTLQNVTGLFVPGLAEWAGVYLLDERGAVSQLAVAHADESKAELVRTMWERYGAKAEADHLVTRAIRERKAQVSSAPAADALASVAVDAEHLELMRRLRLGAGIVVPILAGERVLGALTFVRASDREDFGEHDVELAEELGRRAGVAIDNARLYEEAEQRARAAEALEFVGDGVFLLDRDGIVRLWNPAAEAITGVPAATVEGRPADQAVPGWAELASRIPIVDALGDATGRPETLPFDLGSREVWLSISGVGFPEGTVFAFRDVTEERGVEQMKSDFVATVSHELRTPLAAIYGAALTLRREDLPLEHTQRDLLLGVVSTEAERLAKIVNDILWTSRIETGGLQVTISSFDAAALAAGVVDAARLSLPQAVTLELHAPAGLPPLAADPDKVRQVLANLLDNAAKYSPDGGGVELRLEQAGERLRFLVLDEGIGIPPGERRRVFEKFYRLDPNLTRGVGGTGLGLYISRELVRRMQGRIWVDGREPHGTIVVVELPVVPA